MGFPQKSKVALGLAFSKTNIGGVRNYLEKIYNSSIFDITLFPNHKDDSIYKNNQTYEYKIKLLDNKQDIINSHYIFHSNVDPIYIKLCQEAQSQGKKWVHTYHTYYREEYEVNGKLLNWQKEINDSLFDIASKADIRISVSKWLQKDLKNRGIDTIYIPNFVDVYNGKTIHKNEVFFLFVGDISLRKNCIEFIQTACICPEYKFVLIGENLYKETIEQTYSLNIPKNIIALGPLSHLDTISYISSCSGLIINSITEGIPTVLLEGMLYSKPCIIPIGPLWSDNLFDNGEVLKYQIGDIVDLKDKIMSIITDYKSIPQARECILQNFSSDIVIKQIDTIYQELSNE